MGSDLLVGAVRRPPYPGHLRGNPVYNSIFFLIESVKQYLMLYRIDILIRGLAAVRQEP